MRGIGVGARGGEAKGFVSGCRENGLALGIGVGARASDGAPMGGNPALDAATGDAFGNPSGKGGKLPPWAVGGLGIGGGTNPKPTPGCAAAGGGAGAGVGRRGGWAKGFTSGPGVAAGREKGEAAGGGTDAGGADGCGGLVGAAFIGHA
jgi:hypothetical protein